MIPYWHVFRVQQTLRHCMVPHPLSCRGISDRETCKFPTWRVPHYGEFTRSESNSMDEGRWSRVKIMRKLGPCRFEMEKWQTSYRNTRLSSTWLTTSVGVKVSQYVQRFWLKTSIGRTDGRRSYINIAPTACWRAVKIKYAERYSLTYSDENKNISDTQDYCTVDLRARLSMALLSLTSIFPDSHK